jgi:hypothetical protein
MLLWSSSDQELFNSSETCFVILLGMFLNKLALWSWKYLQKCISASGQRSTTTQFTLQVVSHTACTVHYILYSTSLCRDLVRALHHCHVAETSPGVIDFTMALEATPLESLEVKTASLNERFSSELFFSYCIIDQGCRH